MMTDCLALACVLVCSQPLVHDERKIDTHDDALLVGILEDGDRFGTAVASIGDINGDGVTDLLVGTPNRGLGGSAWVLLMGADGRVADYAQLGNNEGGFPDALDPGDAFGTAVALVRHEPDTNRTLVAIGAPGDDDDNGQFKGHDRGAIWLVDLDDEGRAATQFKISDAYGGFGPELADDVRFGSRIDQIGDIDGDGMPEMAVSAPGDPEDDFGGHAGSVWVLSLDDTWYVSHAVEITDGENGFAEPMLIGSFGRSIAGIGDIDGDMTPDIIVGGRANEGGSNADAFWVLLLNSDGTVRAQQMITDTVGGFDGDLHWLDRFSHAVTGIGDLDGDGVGDVVVGARDDVHEGVSMGAIWVLLLNADGTVKDSWRLGSDALGAMLNTTDQFGSGVALLSSQRNGVRIVAGAAGDDEGGSDRGSIRIIALGADGGASVVQKICDAQGGLGEVLYADEFGDGAVVIGDVDANGFDDLAVGTHSNQVFILFLGEGGVVIDSHVLSDEDLPLLHAFYFGDGVGALGDLDGDGVPDLIVGAPGDDDGFPDAGAAWLLMLHADGSIKTAAKISATEGGFDGELDAGDDLGHAVGAIGDLDGDGVTEIAIGAIRDDDGAPSAGAVWIVFLNADGTVKDQQKISAIEGGFADELHQGDAFGSAIARLGDIDGDGVPDIGVGAPNHMEGGSIWILMLNADGTVKDKQRVGAMAGGFHEVLEDSSFFGRALGALGDINGDGVTDIGVGDPGDRFDGELHGAAYVMLLNDDGTVKTYRKFGPGAGGFEGVISAGDYFGTAVSATDLDGDGLVDVIVGAEGDGQGAVWQVMLNPYCYADFNVDGVVDVLDLVNYQLAWQGGESSADCDEDGSMSILDFICFQLAFQAGCP